MFGMVNPAVRVTCVCRHPPCGLRKVTLPLTVYQRAHGVECDRCGLLMTCVSCLVGVGSENPDTTWSDVFPQAPTIRALPIPVLVA